MENVSDFAAGIIAMVAAKAPEPEEKDYIGDDGLILYAQNLDIASLLGIQHVRDSFR